MGETVMNAREVVFDAPVPEEALRRKSAAK
jgi:hypothetical protein